jgi:predicted alpha-1,2-mannosidase
MCDAKSLKITGDIMRLISKWSQISIAISIATTLAGCGGGNGNMAVDTLAASDSLRSADTASADSAKFGDIGEIDQDTPHLLNLTQFVNPFTGTADTSNPPTDPVPAGQRGGTFPGATMPFGMVQWTPMTPSANGSNTPIGYVYTENKIIGFPLTQMSGSGCSGNSGEIPIMPTYADGPDTKTESNFKHSNEAASPGYYRVILGNGIKTELTATTRTGFGRFTFPINNKNAAININPTYSNTGKYGGKITSVDEVNKIVKGYANGGGFCGGEKYYKVYFSMHFETRPGIDISVVDGPRHGDRLVQFISRDSVKSPGEVLMKVGLSYVSAEKAEANLEAENPGWNFRHIRKTAHKTWNKYLNAIQVQSGNGLNDPKHQADYERFYTALYHSMMSPNINSDVDGQYLAFDGSISNGSKYGGPHYVNFSNWDTYRSLIPLLAMLYPKQTGDMIQSTIEDADVCGAIPRWSAINNDRGIMPGDSGVNVVAGAYAFGAKNFDTAKALQYMQVSGNSFSGAPASGVNCNGSAVREIPSAMYAYLSHGYVPNGMPGVWGSGSLTYEFVANDAAVASFAHYLGDDKTYRIFTGHAANWKNLFDSKSGMMLPRYYPDQNGIYFNNHPVPNSDMVEGNAAQYNWMNTFNSLPLFDLMNAAGTPSDNGTSPVVRKLNKYFERLNVGMSLPNFYIGNEPSFAGPWQYNWAGAPALTQRTVHSILYGNATNKPAFSTGPGGLPGNDDLGATSSWFVWASIGLFPSIPEKGGLTVHGPTFDSVVIKWSDGANQLAMHTSGSSGGARSSSEYYLRSVALNNSPLDLPWVWLSSDLKQDSKIDFSMSSSPQTWGSDQVANMPSFGVEQLASTGDHSVNEGFHKDGEKLVLNIEKYNGGYVTYRMDGLSFDGGGQSYSANDLKSTWGIGPGSKFRAFGGSFVWPKSALDNTVSRGQTLYPSNPGQSYSSFAMLASANNGPSKGKLLVNYTDGSTETADLILGDWVGNCSDSIKYTPIASTNREIVSQVAMTMYYRLDVDGKKVFNNDVNNVSQPAACIFHWKYELDKSKAVKSVTLPYQVTMGQQHIFTHSFY